MTWSTLNYLLVLRPLKNQQSTPLVILEIFKKYYATDKLIKKIFLNGFVDDMSLLINSYEDYEIEKLLKNINNLNKGVNLNGFY